jgi:hypothetical protein
MDLLSHRCLMIFEKLFSLVQPPQRVATLVTVESET